MSGILKYLFAFALVLPFGSANAQLFIIDNCNPLVESIFDVAYVVRQDYELIDKDGNEFGRDGNEYFGYSYGPALNINGQIVFSKITHQPFLSDTSYKSFGADYTPVSSHIFTKLYDEADFIERSKDSLIDGELHVGLKNAKSTGLTKNKFSTDSTLDCIIITYLPIGKTIDDNTTFRLSYLKTKIKWTKKGKGILDNKELGANAAFGLIFYQVIETGSAHLEFGGFVEKVDDKWKCTPYKVLTELSPKKEANNKKKGGQNKKSGKGKKKKP